MGMGMGLRCVLRGGNWCLGGRGRKDAREGRLDSWSPRIADGFADDVECRRF